MEHAVVNFLVALVRSTTALLIVLNPLALIPVVSALIGGLDLQKQRKIAGQSVLIGSGLLLVFTFAGTMILSIFGITLFDLKVAGGLLLLSIAFSFVLKGSLAADMKFKSGPSAAPIASPILVGPGAITTAVVLVKTNGVLITALAVAIASMASWLVFRSTNLVYKTLGESGSDVIARVMGILLAAIAVVYVRDGIIGLMPMITHAVK